MEITKEELERLYHLKGLRGRLNIFNIGYWVETTDIDVHSQDLGFIKILWDNGLGKNITRITRKGMWHMKALPLEAKALMWIQHNTYKYLDQRYKPLRKIFSKLKEEQFPIFLAHENRNAARLAKQVYDKRVKEVFDSR